MIVFTGWTLIDPLRSLFIVVFILFSTLRLLREALHGLMDGVPFSLSLETVAADMAAQPGVSSAHDLHAWSLSSRRLALSAHVVLEDTERWDAVLAGMHTLLSQRYGIGHITLQSETNTHMVRLGS